MKFLKAFENVNFFCKNVYGKLLKIFMLTLIKGNTQITQADNLNAFLQCHLSASLRTVSRNQLRTERIHDENIAITEMINSKI